MKPWFKNGFMWKSEDETQCYITEKVWKGLVVDVYCAHLELFS